MTEPVYPSARTLAEKVYRQFARHRAAKHPSGPESAVLPDPAIVAAIIDAAFWASLRKEEGYPPRISLAFARPENTYRPLTFERPIPLDSQSLTRMAPAVDGPGVHLGVWLQDDELRVWGCTHGLPPLCFVLEVSAPGLLVFKESRPGESGKFINVAVLQGNELKVVDETAAVAPGCPEMLTSLLGFEPEPSATGVINVLIQLAVAMRAHGRGGTLLVVPVSSRIWRESIRHPILYAVEPAWAELSDLMRADPAERTRLSWQDGLARAVTSVAGLTAVDGATIITPAYDVMAFGAKIIRRKGSPSVAQVMMTEPVEGDLPITVDPVQLGGTRHLSAAQFVYDQRDALALVASQDGRFTVFGWSPCEEIVHVHRIDTLLL